ncbi:MAG: A24 family peptidase [Acidobacteria bacterium]|nr:A24 family peptidase [Acidobacteriota bacterium]
MSYPPIVLQIVLALVAFVAAVYDFRFRRIPNWLTLSGVLLGIGLSSFLNVTGLNWYSGYNWRSALAGMGLAFAVYFPLYLLRGMGAGDVKLMAAIGAIVGPSNWFWVFVLSNILGGLVAVVLLLSKGRARRTFSNVGYMLNELAHLRPPYLRREELDVKSHKAVTMPHGIAIAIGSFVFLAASGILAR